MLPKLAEGEANKVWIVPSELGKAVEGIGGAFTRLSTPGQPGGPGGPGPEAGDGGGDPARPTGPRPAAAPAASASTPSVPPQDRPPVTRPRRLSPADVLYGSGAGSEDD